MGRKAEKILSDLEEELNFISQLGIKYFIKPVQLEEPANNDFRTLEQEILTCRKCHLHSLRKHAVPGEGNLKAELMFVGEAPGQDEDIQGRPFVGRAGKLLTRIINAMGFKREDVFITNIVKCHPPNNRNPNQEEINSCKDYLYRQISIIRPRVIVTLGNVPTHFFIPLNEGISKLRGGFYEVDQIQIMPTFHPSYLIRNEAEKTRRKMVWEDMQKVMALLGKK
ncbi:MAG: uracil-DNA glycosylase [Candidatus Aminicenantes bacterium]|nr:uracil-DNA glycosylase [Candidatus Aminicenantes bacterium]